MCVCVCMALMTAIRYFVIIAYIHTNIIILNVICVVSVRQIKGEQNAKAVAIHTDQIASHTPTRFVSQAIDCHIYMHCVVFKQPLIKKKSLWVLLLHRVLTMDWLKVRSPKAQYHDNSVENRDQRCRHKRSIPRMKNE